MNHIVGMKKLIIPAFLLLAVGVTAGCQSKSVSEMSYSEVKDYANRLLERCRKQGAKDGAEMQACINQEALADETKRRNAIATRQAIGGAMAAAGQGYSNAHSSSPVTCTSTPSSGMIGGPVSSVRTTCY